MVVDNDLFLLMRDGSYEDVSMILDNFEVTHIVDLMGSTLLHYSATSGNERVTSYLLARGCHPDVNDVKGITPLMLAIRHKHNSVIRTLLRANADIDIVSRSGRDALDMAFNATDGLCTDTLKLFLERVRDKCSTRRQLVERLLESGCQLYHAIFLKDSKLIRHVLDMGYPIESRHPGYGYTTLHIAVSLIDLESVRLLLRYGADANAYDYDLQTPLFYLYNFSTENSQDKLEILSLLLNSGISLMTHTLRGFYQVGPSLSRACREGVRQILKSNHVDFTANDGFDKKTLLHHLATNGSPGIVEELKAYNSKKYDVNVVDKWGISPLYSATDEGNVDMVKFLLENGANPNVRHKTFGFTPLCFAVLEPQRNSADHYDRCTELLLQYDADPQISFLSDNDESLTIFDSALITKTFDRVKFVIAHIALLECKGVVINELTYSKIQLHWIYKDYFEACRNILRSTVFDTVPLFELLTGKDKVIARHLRDRDFLSKLRRIGYKCKAKASYQYYCNTLQKRISNLLSRMRLEDNATVVICKFFKGRASFNNLVVEKIIGYLDNVSLLHLCQL